MDSKNKFQEYYNPDKKAQDERVVVGLAGDLDSYVCAYLLKIQNYEVFAVTILPEADVFENQQDKILSCHLNESKLKQVQEFCQQLKIPHHTVKGKGEFREEVLEQWIAAKVTGTVSNACWACHDLRLRLLYLKSVELGAKFLATGHYAKLFRHEGRDTFYVHTSNDERHDQSSYLARLPHDILSHLMLPLSDLTKKEVLKLADNFGLQADETGLKMHECLKDSKMTLEFLEQTLPERFRQEGEIQGVEDELKYGFHSGIIHHNYGDKAQLPGVREELFLSGYTIKDHTVTYAPVDYFRRTRVLLVNCRISEETSLREPITGVVRFANHNMTECWIYPNSINGATLEWENPLEVKEGEIVSVFKKKGKNAKVFLTGEIRFLDEQRGPQNEGEEHVEIHLGRDF